MIDFKFPWITSARLACMVLALCASAPVASAAVASAPAVSAAVSPSADSAAKFQAGLSDTASAPTDSVQKKQLYEYIAYPLLQALTWPAETILVPTVRIALYPIKPPLRYFLNENVIDRTISLISFGRDNQIMLYPTINLAPGTGSYTGLTYRNTALFANPRERLVAQGNLYVNGDWKIRSYLTSKNLAGTDFTTRVKVTFNRVKNTSFNQPGTNGYWFYSDSSNVYQISLSHPIIEKFMLNGAFLYRDNHFGIAPPPKQGKDSNMFFRRADGTPDPKLRGLEENWTDRILAGGIDRDTRNNENIVLAGSQFNAGYHYHLTSAHHDFQGYEMEFSEYFKLGKEKYEISADEERKAGAMSIQKVLEKMEYEKLKHEIFNRKVFVVHAYVGQSFEVAGNHMPVYGLQTLGNDTPLRGYGGSRFRDYAVASISSEYRFPIMRLVDGVMFNEYGVFGRSWDSMAYLANLRNSWGFGIRVRRPDIYLFRLQMGFHGDEGIELNMSVDEPF